MSRFSIPGVDGDLLAFLDVHDGYITLFEVHPENRGLGLGTRLLSHVCRLADEQQQELRLRAQSSDDRQEDLVRLYERFGFEDDGDTWMIRQPVSHQDC
jgi:ribosomal protein S18 acetylase RimI-like enzyme